MRLKTRSSDKTKETSHGISHSIPHCNENTVCSPSTHAVQRDQSTITSLVHSTPYRRKSRGSGVGRSISTSRGDLSVDNDRAGQEGSGRQSEGGELREHCAGFDRIFVV